VDLKTGNGNWLICHMFTGIVEAQGVIKKVLLAGTNKSFWIRSPLSSKLKPDQSVCHDGVCLTIEEVKSNRHRVTAIAETLNKTTIGSWQTGKAVNLERCLKLNGRLDGHFVQGHIDSTARCTGRTEKNGSWQYSFQFPEKFSHLLIEKGSVTVNGICFTAFNVTLHSFDIAVIPYTFEHTNINTINPGTDVNLEFDMIGKYISRKLSLNK
jgi:riboflavin synthase